MNPTESFMAALKQNFSGTLAELKAEAEKELNGTKFIALKHPDGRRFIMAACFTGAHEISKVRKNVAATDIQPADWVATRLTEALAAATFTRRFICLCDGEKSNPTALALISADPDSITKLEFLLGLHP